MILRIVRGGFPANRRDAAALVDLRDSLTRAARAVDGLESLIIGARRDDPARTPDDQHDGAGAGGESAGGDPAIEAIIVSVWRDAETMLRATGTDGDARFAERLALPFEVTATDHYEVLGRTFAALPAAALSVVHLLQVTADSASDQTLAEAVRELQRRSVELGMIASLVGRRLAGPSTTQTVHVSVWTDRAALRAATGGSPTDPLHPAELAPWRQGMTVELFDGTEITPRLPERSGPPLLVLDERLRIVDVTATAAALLGRSPEDLVGVAVGDLSTAGAIDGPPAWPSLLADGVIEGESAWAVPTIGEVLLRFVGLRDRPIPGRHAILVARRHDPAPTLADLDAVVAEAFPAR